MPTIRQLPPGLINKIAAGEVIERPASVVKELLENSVDSGATSIELTIEGGGIELIRISDNGCGIEPEQIPLAIDSHATSKLETADDLFDVHTLGFRGEALASISEVSHLTLRTRTADAEAGSEMSVRGGERTPVLPTGCPVGTSIEVRHLFFNTPVRRKFLRTPQTEAGHITEAFTRIALAFPKVKFVMRSGNRVTHELPATDDWRERIQAFFGDEIASGLIPVASQQVEASLTGFVADPSVSRSNNRLQYIFLNGRHIRDKSLQHALGEAYRGLLMVGRFPVCFLRLEIPADQVDVNVHPTKMEVRFQESGKLYSQLLKTLRHEFLTTDLTARARHVPGPVPKGLRPEAESEANPKTGAFVEPPSPSNDEQRWEQHAEAVTNVAASPASNRSGLAGLGLTDSTPAFQPFSDTLNRLSGLAPASPARDANSNHTGTSAHVATVGVPPGAQPWDGGGPADDTASAEAGSPSGELPASESAEHRLMRVDPVHSQDAPLDGNAGRTAPAEAGVPGVDAVNPTNLAPETGNPAAISGSSLGFQVHNRYLITQDENGMVVIDQHALHERIIYEQLRAKADTRSLESQQLLVPEPLDFTPSEAAAAIEHQELLKSIGIGIEPFGGDTILLTSYPAILGKLRPAEVLRQVLEPLMAGGKQPDARDLMDELLNMFACKAAIKAGDKLSGEEVTALLEQRFMYQDTHHCPHGRPTALFFSREQLDKMFKRT